MLLAIIGRSVALNYTFIGQCRGCFTHQRSRKFKSTFAKSANKHHLEMSVRQCKKCAKGNLMVRRLVSSHVMKTKRHVSKIHLNEEESVKLLYSKSGVFLSLCNECQKLCHDAKIEKGILIISLCSDCSKFNVKLQKEYWKSFRANDWRGGKAN